MRTFFIFAASALLLAAVTVELSTRLWPGSSLALLIIAAIALLAQGYLSLRLAPAPVAAGKRPAPREAQPRKPSSPATPQPSPESGERESGTVKWFNRSKGFGFIVRESGEEIFVHQRSIRAEEGDGHRRPTLKDGQAVTFSVANREKGLQAEDVAPA
ncbi:MAG: cold shock domain-containing protein [Pseudomonadales bacterium]|jgi:CspA family cold shock protein